MFRDNSWITQTVLCRILPFVISLIICYLMQPMTWFYSLLKTSQLSSACDAYDADCCCYWRCAQSLSTAL